MTESAPPPSVDASRDDVTPRARPVAPDVAGRRREDSSLLDSDSMRAASVHAASGSGATATGDISPWMRVLLFSVGGILVLIGIAGLVLPGIQGILTIAVGLALLSVVSGAVHRWTQRGLQRWPSLLQKMENFRSKIRRRLGRKK